MTHADTAAITTDLTRDEGIRLFVYDDATGFPIRPGTLVKGHPTIGAGRALDVHGLTPKEVSYLLGDDVDQTIAALERAEPKLAYADIGSARLDVLVEMLFNMGLTHFLGFRNMIAALEAGNYAIAAAEMRSSAWAKQVGARAERLAKAMETGVAT